MTPVIVDSVQNSSPIFLTFFSNHSISSSYTHAEDNWYVKNRQGIVIWIRRYKHQIIVEDKLNAFL